MTQDTTPFYSAYDDSLYSIMERIEHHAEKLKTKLAIFDSLYQSAARGESIDAIVRHLVTIPDPAKFMSKVFSKFPMGGEIVDKIMRYNINESSFRQILSKVLVYVGFEIPRGDGYTPDDSIKLMQYLETL